MVETKKTKRPTLGKLLADTEAQHLKQANIEVGEFVETVGNKEYMKGLWECIEKRSGLPQWSDKYYILVLCKKNVPLYRVVDIRFFVRHSRPLPIPGWHLWSYDPKSEKLHLEWVLPDKHAFKTFLSVRHYTDPFLMECIDRYLAGKLG